MMTVDQLRGALDEVPGVTAVKVWRDGRLLAVVAAASFEGQNEAARQAGVWRHLQARFDDEALRAVEFVFTRTPAEHAAA